MLYRYVVLDVYALYRKLLNGDSIWWLTSELMGEKFENSPKLSNVYANGFI
jgi:hypothetical protein